jgi:glycosyltransferase involved in cell wall biosynthesis
MRLCAFIDRAFIFLLKSPYLLLKLNTRFIRQQIDLDRPDVLHSHLLTADKRVVAANEKKVRHVTTIHGDYISILKENKKGQLAGMIDISNRLDTVVTISDEQIKVLTEKLPNVAHKLKKIYNGYVLPRELPQRKERSTFNFGLIARGIPEKGWEIAIKAFIRISAPNTRLYLYGESPFLFHLRKKYPDNRIVFKGFTSSPLEAAADLDVGLLPSYYTSESLPTTIIEYLALGKPVIASAVGEIPLMINSEGPNAAGILIPANNPADMVEPLYIAMNKLMLDSDLYDILSSNCNTAFEKFSMDKCVDSYLNVYLKEKAHVCAVS